MEQCDYLVPRDSGLGVPVEDGEDGECLLKKGHEGEHLVETSEGFYLWYPQEWFCEEDGKVCDCDFTECYIYQHIPDAQAKQILAKDGAGAD